MKGNNNTVQLLVTGAIIAILVAALITAIATETQNKTMPTVVTAEEHAILHPNGTYTNITAQYTVTNAPTGWKSEDCPLTNFAIKNQSGSALTLTTDYLVTLSSGNYTLKNNSATIGLIGAYNNTYVYYDYCANEYVNSSWGRSLLNLTPGLIAIALLVAMVYIAYVILGREQED